MLKLEVRTGPKTGKLYQVAKSATIGRSQDNQVFVLDPQVSRYHARVFLEGGEYWVEDTGSYNGTQVNEERVAKRILCDGDLVRVGNTEFKVSLAKDGFSGRHKLLVTPEGEGTHLVAKSAKQMVMPSMEDQGLETYLKQAGVSGFDSTEEFNFNEHHQKVLLQAQRFAVLYDIAKNLQQNLKFEDLIDMVVDYVFRIFGQVDSVTVIIKDEDSGQLIPALSKDRTGTLLKEVKLSRTIISEVLESGLAIITADAETDRRFSKAQSVMLFGLHSLMCVPMVSRENIIGILQVSSQKEFGCFSEEDMFLMSVIASLAAVAIENSRLVTDLRSTISELQLAQDELVATQKHLVEQEKLASVGQVASGIAHEIKNMLSPIMLADLIRQRYPGDETVGEYADLIMESYDRILAVTNEVRAFTSGRGESFNIAAHSLEDLAQSTVRFLRYDREVKTVAVDVTIKEDCAVAVDAGRMKQVLINLIRNSAQSVDQASGRIELVISRDGSVGVIDVKDNGCGIAEENLSQIWEPFFTTRGDRGTGLGLHISRMIIERHNGEIVCTSSKGVGTTMTIRLPLWRQGEGA